jgi:hypothetical protein
MALTQEQVDWWFSQNPNATAEDVAAAVKSIGGLEANAGLAGMLANRFSIAEPEVTNYYNTYVGEKPPTTQTTPTTPTTNTDTQTFTDSIINTPTTETDLLTTLADTTTGNTTGNTAATNIVTSGTPTTQQDLLATLAAPADNINSNNGYVKPATRPTSGGVSNVVEGDNIEQQIAQLPQEYASWQSSSIPGYIDFIRKSDGAVLDRRQNNTFSDLDLLKIGLSFIPGAGQILAAINVADAARTGNWTQAAIGATGLVPGMQNVNTALRVGQAVDSGNGLGAITALAGNTDVQNLLGLGNVNVGGFTAKDAMTAAQLASAASSGNTAGVLTSLGTLAGSSDTVLAGRALGLITRIQNGDTKALGEAVNLANSFAGGSTSESTGTTGANITTLTDEDLAELNATELAAYKSGGVEGLANYRRSVRAGTTTSSLPTGVQLASTGDGVFRTDVGGVPTYAESSNASTVTAPLGYTLLSMSESDDKPAGSYYDITANAWFKPDTAVTNLTGDSTIQADTALFNNSLGTLDQLDSNRSANDFADFLATLGITNTTQLADSGLSNQDILDMINALDDTVVVTGGTGNDVITGGTGNDVITGGDGNDGIPTVLVEACKDGKVRDPVTGQCVLPTTITDTTTGGDGTTDLGTVTVVDKKCPPGQVYDEDLKMCIPIETVTIVDKKCPPGQVYDEDLKKCVPIADDSCPTGYERDEITGKCIPVVTIVDKKCPPGQVYDEELKKCVPILDDSCPEGFERDEATGKCIPVVTIVDKKCPPGQVYDEDLQQCVLVADNSCPTGFHKDESGKCVPDTKETLSCPEGYEPNEAGTACIPVVTIVDKKCPPGQVYDEELKKCVPIVEDKCADGFHRDEATGLCVPDDDGECKTGYEKVNGTCVPVCKEGYIRNLETGVCEKAETPCPAGQTRNAEGKCVPIVITPPVTCQPGYERINGVCVPMCQPGYVRVNGVCKKITADTVMPTSVIGEQGEKTDPIYAGGMDSFNLLATLQELLAEEPPKKDDKKSKDKTKMATGGHLDDLLAEQMTVDDLLKLLR